MTAFCLIIATVYYFSPMAIGDNYVEFTPFVSEKIIRPIIGQDLLPTAEIEASFYNIVNTGINNQLSMYKEWISFGSAFGVFVILKVLTVPLLWIITLISVGIFKGLVLLGAIKIQERSVLQEMITL